MIVVDDREVRAALAKATAPALNKTLQRGTAAGAKFLSPKVKAEAPRRTGTLRKAIRASKARRERPASIVKVGKKAWYEHFVIKGTKAHRIRFPDQKAAGVPKAQGNIAHPGAKANPFVDRAGERYGDEAFAVAVKVIREELP